MVEIRRLHNVAVRGEAVGLKNIGLILGVRKNDGRNRLQALVRFDLFQNVPTVFLQEVKVQ